MTATTGVPARSRAQIVASGVRLTRGAQTVLDGLDLTLTPTSRTAVVGENGRGKSTLLHLLSGDLVPDEGSVRLVGTLGVAEQEMSTAGDRTVGEAVAEAVVDSLAALADLDRAGAALADGEPAAAQEYAAALEQAEALDAWDAERRVQVALEALGAETDWSRRLTDLSVGERYRVRLACLLGGEADFLLLDEPTNHLDRSGLDFLTDRLRSRAGGVVLVSHDRALLADVARTVIDLDPTPDGRPRTYGGGYAGYRTGRRAELARWQQEHDRQVEQLSRLEEDLGAAQDRLVSGWRPDKGTGKHQRATRAGGLVQSVHRRREAVEAHRVSVPPPPRPLHFPELPTRPGATLLTAEEVTVPGRLREPVSLTLRGGSRLLVTGPNGAGKSTLLALLAGDLQPGTGTVRRSGGSRVVLLRQESGLAGQQRAADVYARHVAGLVSAGVVASGEVPGLGTLGLLGPREAAKRVGDLSMGQQRRLDLAMVLAGRPHAILLDEPTNHLSISLVDELTEALGATRAAVVVSSHDRQLLRDVGAWPQLGLGAG